MSDARCLISYTAPWPCAGAFPEQPVPKPVASRDHLRILPSAKLGDKEQ